MANYETKKSIHQHTSQKNGSANINDNISDLISDRDANSYKFFQRATETLILFQGCPNPKLIKLLQVSNVAIGVVLSSDEFKSCPSIAKYSYALIGTVKDKRPSYTQAIKELSMNGWKVVDPSKETGALIGHNFLAFTPKLSIDIKKIA